MPLLASRAKTLPFAQLGVRLAFLLQPYLWAVVTEVAGYARVSTPDQNLDRQIERIATYAERVFGIDSHRVDIYRDKSTGTDVARDGYQSMMSDAADGSFDAIVVHSVSRVARSIQDLERTVDQLRAAGVELHVVEEGIEMVPGEEDPYQRALLQLLGVFSELEAKIKRQNIREGIAARQQSDGYHHGRPPLGFVPDGDGGIVEADNYQRVCAVLEEVAKGRMSQRQAAKELDVARKTIRRALNDRPDLYGL